MKRILYLIAALSLFAFNSCQDNTTPEIIDNEDLFVSRITGAYMQNRGDYYEDGSTNLQLYLLCNGTGYYSLPVSRHIFINFKFPGEVTELPTGTYDTESSEFRWGELVYLDREAEIRTELELDSLTIDISKSGDRYTIALDASLGFGPDISATYTGTIEELDWESGAVFGSGSFEAAGLSGSLECAYVYDYGYDEDDDETEFDICIDCEPSDGQSRSNYFYIELFFPGKLSELPEGTYELGGEDVIFGSYYTTFNYYDGTDWIESHFESLKLEISKTGAEHDIKVSGTLEDGSTVSADFSGHLAYFPRY